MGVEDRMVRGRYIDNVRWHLGMSLIVINILSVLHVRCYDTLEDPLAVLDMLVKKHIESGDKCLNCKISEMAQPGENIFVSTKNNEKIITPRKDKQKSFYPIRKQQSGKKKYLNVLGENLNQSGINNSSYKVHKELHRYFDR